MEALFEFLSKYIDLTEQDKKVVIQSNTVRTFKKNETIKPLSLQTTQTFFVLSGAVYSQIYYPKTVSIGGFFFKGQPVLLPGQKEDDNYRYEILCIEDTSVAIGDEASSEYLIQKYPQFERVCRLFAEETLQKQMSFFDQLKTLPAQEKYDLAHRERADLIGRVPQFLLAQFLGITQETLSRVRKRSASSRV